MDIKTKPIYMLSATNSAIPRDTYRLKLSEWKKVFHANRNQRKVGAVYSYQTK